jgi:tetratricopeptide (TPR) repeat protein
VQLHPELITPEVWDLLREKPEFAKTALPFPQKGGWFAPMVPSGTAFDVDMRAFPLGGGHVSTEDLERWAQMSPYNYMTLWNVTLRHTAGKPDFEAVRAAYATVGAYTTGALLKLHEAAATPEQQIATARQLCDLDVDDCDLLGRDLLSADREKEAAEVFDHFATHARNSVNVSNEITWIVRYHYEQGDTMKALELARKAGDTWSAWGMDTLALLLDRMGRYDAARMLYERVGKRYDNRLELGLFDIRQARRTHNAQLEAEGLALLGTPFPNGLEPASVSSLNGPPRDGIVFVTFGARAERLGFHQRDVLVAFDNVRIHDSWQYGFASRLSHDTHVPVILWRDGRYQQLQLVIPQRWLGVTYDTYEPKKSQAD